MSRFSKKISVEVSTRANRRCEYCQLPEGEIRYPFHIEHITSRKHGGSSEVDNLAWSCIFCSRFKGSDVAAHDPETGSLTELFHPRYDHWDTHFEIARGFIQGKTPKGRATASLLRMNTPPRVDLRLALISAGRW